MCFPLLPCSGATVTPSHYPRIFQPFSSLLAAGLTHNGTNLKLVWAGINTLFSNDVLPYLVQEANKIAAATGTPAPAARMPPVAASMPGSVSIRVTAADPAPTGGGSAAVALGAGKPAVAGAGTARTAKLYPDV